MKNDVSHTTDISAESFVVSLFLLFPLNGHTHRAEPLKPQHQEAKDHVKIVDEGIQNEKEPEASDTLRPQP